MPPPAVKTIKDAIFWQYAKLISKSAGFGINQRAFQMNRFIALRDGKIEGFCYLQSCLCKKGLWN